MWESGAAAAAHSKAQINNPAPRAIAVGSRLLRLRRDLTLWPGPEVFTAPDSGDAG